MQSIEYPGVGLYAQRSRARAVKFLRSPSLVRSDFEKKYIHTTYARGEREMGRGTGKKREGKEKNKRKEGNRKGPESEEKKAK